MQHSTYPFRLLAAAIVVVAALVGWRSAAGPSASAPERGAGESAVIVLAGGCYWGVEAVFEHVAGVTSAVSGFATPERDPALEGRPHPRHRSHAEAVRIEYDPAVISYERILEIFFTIAHDPTELDRQGPDIGPQYRSAIFVTDSAEAMRAAAYVDSLAGNGTYKRPVTTEVLRLSGFREAGDDQQDYVARNPRSRYVIINDLPKLEKLRRYYPAEFRS